MLQLMMLSLVFSSLHPAFFAEIPTKVDLLPNSIEEFPPEGDVNLQFSTHVREIGAIRIPWISISNHQLVPICYSHVSYQLEDMVRIAQVLCRHSGFMIVTRWFPIIGINKNNSTGLAVGSYCRGDEQLIGHCQWHQAVVSPCNEVMGLECGDCSKTINLAEGSRITLASPGFPVYIPLVTCEWNITLSPKYNARNNSSRLSGAFLSDANTTSLIQLVIQFHQFDLPVPVYDEVTDGLSCRSGSLDILPYQEDINKITLDGRFCGHHSPGNLTILSNRVLIRFIAGHYKVESVSKRGFLAEFLVIQSGLSTHTSLVTQWAVIGLVVVLIVSVVSVLSVRSKLTSLRRHCCCRVDSLIVSRSNLELQPTLDSSRSHSPVGVIRAQSSERLSFHRRRSDSTKTPVHACDLMHWQQTKRLEKWRSAKPANAVDSVEMDLSPHADDTHSYEDIDLSPDHEKSYSGSPGVSNTHFILSSTYVANARVLATNKTRSYDETHFRVYQPLPHSASVAHGISSLMTSPSLPSALSHSQKRSRIPGSGSLLRPPSYFQASSISGESDSSASGIYIDPEVPAEEN